MPCRTISTGGDTYAIICSRGRERAKPCEHPGCGKPGGLLCDFPLAKGGTCSRAFCKAHGQHLAHETDWCAAHVRWWEAIAGLLGVGWFAEDERPAGEVTRERWRDYVGRSRGF
jgi:hypothetical protein